LERAAWDGRVASRASKPNLLVIKVDQQLLSSLANGQFGRPLALGTVFKESLGVKDLLPLQDFLRSRESIYYQSWVDLPWNLVSWTLRKIWTSDSTDQEDKLPDGQFVLVKNVEEAAKLLDRILEVNSSRFDQVFTKSHFDKMLAGTFLKDHHLSETDLHVLLKFMCRDKGSILYDGKTIKIKGSAGDETAITEEDMAISSLKELIEDLQHQTTLLSKRLEELTATAKDAVARRNRVQALAALRSKKLAESSLEKRFATLSQLEQIAAKIQQASDQVQLVRVIEASTGVLRSLNAEIGGADRVDLAVDKLREQMSEVDEVGNVLAEAGTDAAIIDENEIDDELEAMEKEERRKEEEAEKNKRENEAAREAEETKRRLADFDGPPARIPPRLSEGRESPATETAHRLETMDLAERPQPQTAS
jgi:charged multivesicular body protein 7